MKKLTLLMSALLIASISFSQVKTEEDMAKAVFETIQKNDSEALSFYCTSNKKMEKALKGVTDDSDMAKSVVAELKEANQDKMKYAVIASFDKFIAEIEKEKLSLKDAKFEGILSDKIKFDIENLQAKKVKFKMSFGAVNYEVLMNVFKTPTSLFMYDFSFVKEAL